jgi:hypothetical protein
MTSVIKSENDSPSTVNKQKKVTFNIEAYLQELLRDRELLSYFRGFNHVPHIIDNEISRVRADLLHMHEQFLIVCDDLPAAVGPTVTRQYKVFVPIEDYPNYNFIGRLLGPGGTTAKQFEKDLDCKLMIRGKGSLRDKKKEEQKRGNPNWEHLDEELHVLVTVEDAENRVDVRLERVANCVRDFFLKSAQTPECDDALKKAQLREVFYRNAGQRKNFVNGPQVARPHPINAYLAAALSSFQPNLTAPTEYALLNGINSGFANELSGEFDPHHQNRPHKGRYNYSQNGNYRGGQYQLQGQHGHQRNHADYHSRNSAQQNSRQQSSQHHNNQQQHTQAALAPIYSNEFANSYPQLLAAPAPEFLLAGHSSYIDYNNALANSLNSSAGALTGIF